MTAPLDASRIIIPFMPSLSRFALVKVAFNLWNEFGFDITYTAFKLIQPRAPTVHFKFYGCPTIKRAKTSLLLIPTLLRKRVMEAVQGLDIQVLQWKYDHNKLNGENYLLYWRPDGSINRLKTAQQVVLNADIDIHKRFETACQYCLEENIQILWKEMEPSETTEFLKTSFYSMVPFWVERMRGGAEVPWTQAIVEYIASRPPVLLPSVSCSYFFPLLQPADRRKFLSILRFPRRDDLRLCLYSTTREEQEQILRRGDAHEVLLSYFDWPLRSSFLETAEKLWSYIDADSFTCLLGGILHKMSSQWESFDDYELVAHLWNMGQNHYRERARENAYVREGIDKLLSKISEKQSTR